MLSRPLFLSPYRKQQQLAVEAISVGWDEEGKKEKERSMKEGLLGEEEDEE
jgi:hypothetical protein